MSGNILEKIIDRTRLFLDEMPKSVRKKKGQFFTSLETAKYMAGMFDLSILPDEVKILEEFAPRFAPNSECLYVGDTIEKDLVKNADKLRELGFEITLHDKMPDVVLYREEKNWIYFVETVTSVGPIDPKRILEITELTRDVTAGKIYVTAFWDFGTYKKFSETLAWETEVWIAQAPDHMIHLNGDKFLGPRI